MSRARDLSGIIGGWTAKRLGALKPAAATYKTLYQPSGTKMAVCTVQFCNQATTDDNIRIAVVQNASADPTPATTEFIAYDSLVKASGDTGFADRGESPQIRVYAGQNDQIVVRSTNGNVSFVCVGEEGTV